RLPGGAAVAEAVRGYQSHCNSAPVPFPEGALCAIDRLTALAVHGYLVLAAAPGFATEREMRLCHTGSLVGDLAARRPLPVHFHLLAQHYRAQGGASRELAAGRELALQV